MCYIYYERAKRTNSAVARRPNPEKISIKLQYIPSNRKFSALFNGLCCKFVSAGEKIKRCNFHKTLEFMGGKNSNVFFAVRFSFLLELHQ